MDGERLQQQVAHHQRGNRVNYGLPKAMQDSVYEGVRPFVIELAGCMGEAALHVGLFLIRQRADRDMVTSGFDSPLLETSRRGV